MPSHFWALEASHLCQEGKEKEHLHQWGLKIGHWWERQVESGMNGHRSLHPTKPRVLATLTVWKDAKGIMGLWLLRITEFSLIDYSARLGRWRPQAVFSGECSGHKINWRGNWHEPELRWAILGKASQCPRLAWPDSAHWPGLLSLPGHGDVVGRTATAGAFVPVSNSYKMKV